MPDLRRNSNHSQGPAAGPSVPGLPGLRALQSVAFVLVFLAYLVFFMGLLQRVLIIPLAWCRPSAASRIYGPWVRLQARNTLRLLRWLAGVRVSIDGHIDTHPCIVIMNHQSLVDIPIGFKVIPGPLALIPARKRYSKGIPGVSPFFRHARLPLISQKPGDRKADLAQMFDAAKRLKSGENSLLIFPEGHRTKDGSLLPFMPGGLQIALSRAPHPVYCVVADGMWRIRTLADTLIRVAGSRVQVRILGPFAPPDNQADIPAFVEAMRGRMADALEQMRTTRDA
jgi:1-acyl-sn-glycerol-3-phosphate acyltransferase